MKESQFAWKNDRIFKNYLTNEYGLDFEYLRK